MRLTLHLRSLAALFPLLSAGAASVVDRVAVVVDKDVITESEVRDDLRLTEFLDNRPLDLGPAARRQAAEHLVDQQLIRRELELSKYPQPQASEADALLRGFLQSRFHSDAEYRAALQTFGISEEQLKQRLLWQLTAIRFTDSRFGSPQSTGSPPAGNTATDVDQQMDAWLKQARSSSKITFKQEAFQ
jgi:parvulin-like peptidyl-prolyl isomerase